MRGSAKVLEIANVRRLQIHIRYQRNAVRNQVMVLLSFKAGMRAAEIAGLDWTMVLTPEGRLAKHISIADRIAKNRSGRRVPISPELRVALERLRREQNYIRAGPVIRSQRGAHMTARGVVNWFAKLYGEVGMPGCSSHSGRRTFITRAARLLTKSGGSLRDVQELAGHRSLTTTERYIEGDREAQRRLMRLI
jgi:integrase/recombinase XerD